MDFKYKINDSVIKFSLEVGDNWNKAAEKIGNGYTYMIWSIFNNVDNGDNIIQKEELDILNCIFKSRDINKNGILEEKETDYGTCFNKNYIKDAIKPGIEIGEKLYKDIFAKKWLVIPTTGKDISKHIDMINKDNVITALYIYESKTDGKEDLFSGIMKERGLDIDTRLKYVRKIFAKICEYCKDKGVYTDDIAKSFEAVLVSQKKSLKFDISKLDRIVKQLLLRSPERPYTNNQTIAPNGKIDKDFEQGDNVGDCWLLAGIKALAHTPKGLEILNNSLKLNSDGSVTVILKGLNKKYTFSRNEIDRNSHLSVGDLDVRVFEMAVNRYIREVGPLDKSVEHYDITSNTAVNAFKILTGKSANAFSGKITDEHIKEFSNSNKAIIVSKGLTTSKEKNSVVKVKTKDNKTVNLFKHHGYVVLRSDSKYVYIVDPHNSGEEIPLDKKTFKSFFNYVTTCDL